MELNTCIEDHYLCNRIDYYYYGKRRFSMQEGHIFVFFSGLAIICIHTKLYYIVHSYYHLHTLKDSQCIYNCTTELNGLCTDGDVRLEDEDKKYEGRIEICYNGEWATVCNAGVDDSVAVVVCRQLGFSLHSKKNLCLQYDIAYVHYINMCLPTVP